MKQLKADRWNSTKPKQSLRPGVRKNKISIIRQQLLKGEFDLNERLDVTVVRILQDLISPN